MEKKITRKMWTSRFNLVGKAKPNDNTFKMDNVSDSGWKYNSLNLSVDCGEKHGYQYASLMGGYSTTKNNVIYVHGKKEEDGKERDDFENRFTVDWEDRFDDEVLDTVGSSCFIKVGLETTTEGNTFEQKFLSAYDAIDYVKKHLTNDTVISVSGNLQYSFYKDKVSMQRNITSIFLSNREEGKFDATFRQSVLIDKDSVDLREDLDKESKRLKVHTRVLDYAKEVNGVDVRGNFPFSFTFDFDYDDEEKFKKAYNLLFNVKGDKVTQINFEGSFVSDGAVVEATIEDVTDDVKALIDAGLMTEDEVLAKYATRGASEKRCVLVTPVVSAKNGAEIFAEMYTEDDLDILGGVDSLTADLNDDDIDSLMDELLG